MASILTSIGFAPARPLSRASYHTLDSQDDLLGRHTPLVEMQQPRQPSPPRTHSSTLYTPCQDSASYTPQTSCDSSGFQPRGIARLIGSGWKRIARLALLTLLLVLVGNTVATTYIMLYIPKMNGFPVVYRGTCPQAEKINRDVHVAINALSTLALGASSYCMQLLSAPTRATIDRAHSSGGWLDIGVTSLRNLRCLGWGKGLVLTLLALSSLPLHLIYNSVVYTAITTRSYNVLYATQDFVAGAAYNQTAYPDSLSQNVSKIQAQAARWVVRSNPDCINDYAQDFVTEYKNVVAVVSNTTNLSPFNTSSLLRVVVNELPPADQIGPNYDAFSWICDDPETVNRTGLFEAGKSGFIPCSSVAPELQKIASTWWKSGGFQIDYCLVEQVEADCHLHFSPRLMAPVLAMNAMKVLVVLYVAFWLREKPLVTLGDAIESFIVQPDVTTRGMCLISARTVGKMWHRHRAQSYTPQAQRFHRKRAVSFDILSRGQTALLFVCFAAMFASLSACIVFGVAALAPPTLRHAWSLGIGNVRTQNLILTWSLPRSGTSAILTTAIMVNTPQFLLSLLCLAYSRTLTLFHMGSYWDRFGTYSAVPGDEVTVDTHRPLRVSEPQGDQRKTYRFDLPIKYVGSLAVASSLLHWLASQSIFLANISIIPRDNTQPLVDEITTCAYSPQALLWLVAVGVLMATYLIIHGSRRLGGVMPIVSSNSLAISAACQVHVQGGKAARERLVRGKLAWGEIIYDKKSDRDETTSTPTGLGFLSESAEYEERIDRYDAEPGRIHERRGEMDDEIDQPAHCGFSAGPVRRPTEGRLYI